MRRALGIHWLDATLVHGEHEPTRVQVEVMILGPSDSDERPEERPIQFSFNLNAVEYLYGVAASDMDDLRVELADLDRLRKAGEEAYYKMTGEHGG
jgi:hypothetical protein